MFPRSRRTLLGAVPGRWARMTLPQSEAIPQSARYDLVPCPGSGCLKLNGAPGTPKYHKACCPRCAGLGVVPASHSPNPLWLDTLCHMRKPFSSREKKRTEYEPETTVMGATARIWQKRMENALAKLKRGTTESRVDIKARIWERDGGRCQICGIDLDRHALAVGQEHELAPRSRALHQLVGANDFLKGQAFGDDGLDAAFGE